MKYSIALLGIALVACQGNIGAVDDPELLAPDGPGIGPDGLPLVPPCEGVCTGESPLSHLSAAEMAATIRDAFPDQAADIDYAGIPEVIDVRPSYEQTNALRIFAERTAETLAAEYHIGCEGVEICERDRLRSLIEVLYRRPATSEEVDAYVLLFRSETEGVSQKRMLFSALLQSPHFRYHIEVGSPDDDIPRLTGTELASRLSFTIVGTPPDAELRAAGADGELDHVAGLERQARRLLQDPRAGALFVEHYRDLLGAHVRNKTPDGDTTFGVIGALMEEETERFIEAVLDDDGTYATLLTAPYSVMNEALASYYELDATGLGDDFRIVDYDEHRAGLLSHGSVLAGGNVSGWESAAIHRGVAIFHNILCDELEAPTDFMPEDVDFDQPMRHRVDQRTACGSSCHARFNPIGHAFGQFDHAGARHDEEAFDMTLDDGSRLQRTFPIDTSAELTSGSVVGAFDGPVEFANLLAESEAVHLCNTRRWMEDLLGRAIEGTEQSTLGAVHMAHAHGHLHDLIIEIVKSDSFRYRLVPARAEWTETP